MVDYYSALSTVPNLAKASASTGDGRDYAEVARKAEKNLQTVHHVVVSKDKQAHESSFVKNVWQAYRDYTRLRIKLENLQEEGRRERVIKEVAGE